VINFFLLIARKVDEAANFVFVQLIEQECGIYDKCHADDARQDKIDLAWKRIFHLMKSLDPGYVLTKQFKLSRKNGCTQDFLFLILYLSILLH
jgi:hypothetical protein